MTCSDAEEIALSYTRKCIGTTYDDPKAFDNTLQQDVQNTIALQALLMKPCMCFRNYKDEIKEGNILGGLFLLILATQLNTQNINVSGFFLLLIHSVI